MISLPLNYRSAHSSDLEQLRVLGISAWSPFKKELKTEHWKLLYQTISSLVTYANLLKISDCIVCETESKAIVGMAFLVPNGHPDEIYDTQWCHLRFVSVDPNHSGKGIGQKLTELCIELAIKNREQTMALHTSEIMHAARHIYEKMGFQILKEIDKRLGIRYWLYTLDLKKKQKED